MTIIEREFFARPTLMVARELLGQRLVREWEGQRLSGLIVETEAYIGPDDSASHAYRNRNAGRAQVMFGPPGQTYVYFIYGMHYMLNLVTEPAGFPAAVLIRAIEPQEGIEPMQTNRQSSPRLPTSPSPSLFASSPPPHSALTNGPAKLCQALRIDKKLNNWDVTTGQTVWLEHEPAFPDEMITASPRVGINYAQPEDRAAPWRLWVRGNKFVSK